MTPDIDRLAAALHGLMGDGCPQNGEVAWHKKQAAALVARYARLGEPTIVDGRAQCICGYSVLPENWPNHLLRQGRHAPAGAR